MRLLQRNKQETEPRGHRDDNNVRPPADEAPTPTRLSARDYLGILKRAFKRFNDDHMTNIAAALAYYAFLAIPSALLVAAGLFGLLAGPHAVTTLIGKLHGILPGQATNLLEGSLRNLTRHQSTGITVLSIGGVLAFWSLTGAMQNVMWALNIAY